METHQLVTRAIQLEAEDAYEIPICHIQAQKNIGI